MKKCPIRQASICIEQECAWWDGNTRQCIIKTIGESLQ